MKILKGENSTIKARNAQLAAVITNLQTQNNTLIAKLTEMELAMNQTVSQKDNDYVLQVEELKNENLVLQHQMDKYLREKERYEGEIDVYKYFAEENKALRATVSTLSAQIVKLTQISQLESENSLLEMEKWKRDLEREWSEKVQENAQQAWLAARSQKNDYDRQVESNGLTDVLNKLKSLDRTPVSSRPGSSHYNTQNTMLRNIISHGYQPDSIPQSRGDDELTRTPSNVVPPLSMNQLGEGSSRAMQILQQRVESLNAEVEKYKRLYRKEKDRMSTGQSLSIWNSKFSKYQHDDTEHLSDAFDYTTDDSLPASRLSMRSTQLQSTMKDKIDIKRDETVFQIEYEDFPHLVEEEEVKPKAKAKARSKSRTSKKSWTKERESRDKSLSVLSKGKRFLLP